MNETLLLTHTLYIYAYIFCLAIGITLIFIKRDFGRNMFWGILVWFLIFLIFLFTSYSGVIGFGILIFLIALLSIREYYILNNLWYFPYNFLAILFLIIFLFVILFQRFNLFYLIPCISAFVYFALSLFKPPKNINKNVGIGVTGLIYWGWAFFHFLLIRRLPNGFGYIILICTLIALNDNTAFYAGRLLGKYSKKLAPQISPGKTWIGTISGFIITFFIAWIFKYTVKGISLGKFLLIPLLVGILSPIGDLIESAIKRDLNVKDTSKLIPGHGGVMDRFDSWVFVSTVMYYYLRFFINKGV